jgi:outer membrane protein OmpA-like peptidoglycan-associated protein
MAIASLTAPLLAFLMLLGGFGWQYSDQTDEKGTAYVELSSDEPLNDIKVKITGSDGSSLSKSVNLKAGKPTKITWKQKDRQVSYDIEIEANEEFTNGSFDVQRPVAGGKREALELLSDRVDIVDRQVIKYETPFTVSKRTLQVYDTDGDLVVETTVDDQIVEAGGTFEMTYRTNREIFMIKVTAEDETGYSATDIAVPWSFAIPHEEVHFDSGKSIIKPTEEPKVADAFAVLVHELANLDKASAAVDGNMKVAPQLFIVGYTDTVGNGGDNQKLSEERAKAIAKYFFDKGAWCEIYYAGMGERGLAVETADSVDQVANRRALYILDVKKPAGGGAVPGPGAWKQMTGARPRMMQGLPELPESYIAYKAEQQRLRDEKFGTGESSGGDGDGGDGDDDDDGDEGGLGGDEGGGGGDDGTPYKGMDGGEKPGATAKGCATTEPRGIGLGLLAGLFGMIGLRRRRRA